METITKDNVAQFLQQKYGIIPSRKVFKIQKANPELHAEILADVFKQFLSVEIEKGQLYLTNPYTNKREVFDSSTKIEWISSMEKLTTSLEITEKQKVKHLHHAFMERNPELEAVQKEKAAKENSKKYRNHDLKALKKEDKSHEQEMEH